VAASPSGGGSVDIRATMRAEQLLQALS
jgi:hypothetical protein